MSLNVVGFILIVLGGVGALLFCTKADEKEIHDPKRLRNVAIAMVCVIILAIGMIILVKS